MSIKNIIKNIIKMYFSKNAVLFGGTGLLNALVMSLFLSLLGLYIEHFIALIIIIQLSIITDFLLKNYIVFKNVKATGKKIHFEWISLVGVAIQDLMAWLLSGRIEYILLYLLTVLVAFILKYYLVRLIIWTKL